MALDGIFVHHLVKELNETLSKSRLESIHENGSYFVFKFYLNKNRHHLVFNMSASYASCYITESVPQKSNPSSFTNQLKKYLEGGILDSIEQYKSDRVMIFNFTVYDFIEGPKSRRLLFEAMGKHANLFILNENFILDCYKRMFVLEGRHLIPNATFEYFKDDKIEASNYQFNGLLSPKEISSTYQGISLRLAKYLHENPIHPYDIKVSPTLSIHDNKSYFFNIFDGEVKSFNTLSGALASRTMEVHNEKQPYLKFIKDQLRRLTKKETNLLQQTEDATIHLLDKEKADYIYQSGLDLTSKLPFIKDYQLDSTKSLSANAQRFYKNYQKAKRSEEFINREREIVYRERDIFETYLAELEASDGKDINDYKEILKAHGYLKQQSKSTKTSKYRVQILTIQDDHATYFIGKNSLQNGYLLREIAQKNDYWFHLKDSPGSHVVVRSPKINETVIRKASMLAAYFSTFKNSSSIPIDYTLVKYLSKVPGKPDSFVRIRNEKTIFIDIDETMIKNWLS